MANKYAVTRMVTILLFGVLWSCTAAIDKVVQSEGDFNKFAIETRQDDRINGNTTIDWNYNETTRRCYAQEISQHPPGQDISAISIATPACEFGQVYDFDLCACRRECQKDQIYYDIFCVPEKLYEMVSKRASCKNIKILGLPQEENVNDNVPLVEPMEVYDKELFNFGDGTYYSSLCYDFSESFMLCPRMALKPNEYKLSGSHLIWGSNVLAINEFYIGETNEAFVCHKNTPKNTIGDLLASSSFVSAVSLVLTIYIIASTKQWKHHTKVLFCRFLILFVFFVTFTVRHFFLPPGTVWCVAIGVVMNYSFLAAFFWMTVLSYDLWENLASLKIGSSSNTRFYLESLFAWGVPLVTIASAVTVNFATPPESLFNPNYSEICWLSTDTHALLLFSHVPAAAMSVANLTFYVLTVLKLRSMGKDARVVNASVRKQLFLTYTKLLVVMGTSWTAEIIAAYCDDGGWYWNVIGMINCLEGFFIFLIYFCKRRVLRGIGSFLGQYVICFRSCKRSKDDVGTQTTSTAELSSSSSVADSARPH